MIKKKINLEKIRIAKLSNIKKLSIKGGDPKGVGQSRVPPCTILTIDFIEGGF
ncbi:hypothetical protein [Aquimarina algiphila]|uniref:hypothetical protein n=1 Tax=Aquimarina algiphila TaxID=2047982 RepID=UPI00232DD115|nr:hypothetical protein [Aquimarina algiphila]